MVSTPLRISESSPIASPDPCFLSRARSKPHLSRTSLERVRALTKEMAKGNSQLAPQLIFAVLNGRRRPILLWISSPDSTKYIGNGERCPLISVRSLDQSIVDARVLFEEQQFWRSDKRKHCRVLSESLKHHTFHSPETFPGVHSSWETQLLRTLDNRILQLKI